MADKPKNKQKMTKELGKTKGKKEKGQKDFAEQVLFWTVLMAVALVPLLVRTRLIGFFAPTITTEVLNSGLQGDTYTYYKWMAMLALAVCGLAVTAARIWSGKRIRPSYVNPFVLAASLLMLLSCLLAELKTISLLGMYNRHEGLLAGLAYLGLLFIATQLPYSEKRLRSLVLGLGLVVVVNCLLGTACFLGANPLGHPAVKSLIIPAEIQQYTSGVLQATLNNPNYVSGFAGAAFLLFFCLTATARSWSGGVLWGILSLASLLALFSALSSSGLLSVMLLLPLFAVFLGVKGRNKMTLWAVLGLLAVGGLSFTWAVHHNRQLLNEALSPLAQMVELVKKDPALPDAKEVVPQSEPQESLSLAEQGKLPGLDGLVLPKPGLSLGSGRLHIWKETLQLIKSRPLTGYGPDTLAYYFPHDAIEEITEGGAYNLYTDKPHSAYLGWAYGFGVPFLLILLGLFAVHFYRTLKSLWAKAAGTWTYKERYAAAFFAFFLGFLVQWLFNDSIVGTSVIFWPLMGVGVSLNLEE